MEMKGLKKIQVIRAYCDYVEEHLNNVKKAWGILQKALKHENVIYDDHLFWTTQAMIEDHDLSKMSMHEFIQYAEWFHGEYGQKYDIWQDGGEGEAAHKDVRNVFFAAWEHHKKRNLHHWESWPDTPEQFPNHHACHVVCMVADWMAMGMKFGDTAEQYYEAHINEIKIPVWSRDYVERIFRALRKVDKE